MSSHKPNGYPSVSPYLIVDGAAATIDFLVRALDGVELRRFAGEDGKLMHAEVRIDDSVIMLTDGSDAYPPMPAQVHIYVPDVDASYQRALDAGATSIQEPTQRAADDDRRGGVDSGGISWWFATQPAGRDA